MEVAVGTGGGGGGERRRRGGCLTVGCFFNPFTFILLLIIIGLITYESLRVGHSLDIMRQAKNGNGDVQTLATETRKHTGNAEEYLRVGQVEDARREIVLAGDTARKMQETVQMNERIAVKENPSIWDWFGRFFMYIWGLIQGAIGGKKPDTAPVATNTNTAGFNSSTARRTGTNSTTTGRGTTQATTSNRRQTTARLTQAPDNRQDDGYNRAAPVPGPRALPAPISPRERSLESGQGIRTEPVVGARVRALPAPPR